ncbi:MAG TPA: LuxR C-terminal-related transcriptional regulator, partial [Ktedonobacteraceae bacterium]|nr:LuxR C-terminal-related transcriptional regulator [Ktedonobacteraceae bacterium]
LQEEGPAVAWVSLGEGDNDVVRFWRCVASACQGILRERTRTIQEHLTVLSRSPSLLEKPVLELVLTAFVDELATLPGHSLIVLEDYHFITHDQIHASLSFWLEHLPASLRVIMLTRHDPPLPLALWRVRGLLHEIRSGALRFTEGETALFFERQSTHAIPHTDMIQLLERTEGWIAGLQLAVLVLNAQSTEQTASSVLQGPHRYVADYLVQEVLNHLPENVQLFLEQTSLLERFQGRLCEAVTGQPDGQHMLAWLEQANLFLVPLDETRQWYRYHHLFRDILLQRLTQHRPEDLADLHRRAARWFLQERMSTEAVAHAHAAGDFATLAECIEQGQAALLDRGENATLVAWIQLLPQSILLERLPIFFLACMQQMALGRTQAVAELLNTYARQHQLPAVGTHDVDWLEQSLREHVHHLFPPQRGDRQQQTNTLYGFLRFYATLALAMEFNVTLYQQIQQRAEPYTPPFTLRRQEGWLAALLQGNIQEAIADLMENLSGSLALQDDTILLAHIYPILISLLTVTGQLHLVESTARRVLQENTLDARLHHGPALIDLGSVAYERNQLEQAETSIQTGLPLCLYPGAEAARYRGLLLLAKIRRARGDRSAARTILQELEIELAKGKLEVGGFTNWRGLLAWEALNQGDAGYARLWLRDTPVAQDLPARLNPFSGSIYLAQAFFLLRFERKAEAETLLADLIRWAKQLGLHGLLIPLLAFQALLVRAKGEGAQAETVLKEALALAEASGYTRTFLDLGEEAQELLLQLWNKRSAGDRRASSRYLGWLLASARGKVNGSSPTAPAFAQALIEPLSQREQEVLHEIIEGYSNQEIARRLMVTTSTVKSHINSIYRKLQTTSRAQTIARARALALVPR